MFLKLSKPGIDEWVSQRENGLHVCSGSSKACVEGLVSLPPPHHKMNSFFLLSSFTISGFTTFPNNRPAVGKCYFEVCYFCFTL